MSKQKNNIVVIGAGYVGLVSGTCFSEFGANVIVADRDKDKIRKLQNGNIPIYEPGLQELVNKNMQSGNLTFKVNYSEYINNSDALFIAVGTPSRRGDGHADLKYVYEVAEEIATNIEKKILIVNKSTVPVGSARKVGGIIKKINSNTEFSVASNPEFLREGSAIEDFMNPDRVIIGVDDEYSEAIMRDLYRPITEKNIPLMFTDPESAELIKYASNAFLATKISFINEISSVCEKTGANVEEVSKGMGYDSRIGDQFLKAGPGYGGSCFPKDTLALVRIAEEHDLNIGVVKAAITANENQKKRMVNKITDALDGSIAEKRIGILGLTFKPETDDMRDSPSITIIKELIKEGAEIIAHDPHGLEEARNLLPDEVKLVESNSEAVIDADGLVLMTEWSEYLNIELEQFKSKMRGDAFIDLRNFLDKEKLESYGFRYFSVGK